MIPLTKLVPTRPGLFSRVNPLSLINATKTPRQSEPPGIHGDHPPWYPKLVRWWARTASRSCPKRHSTRRSTRRSTATSEKSPSPRSTPPTSVLRKLPITAGTAKSPLRPTVAMCAAANRRTTQRSRTKRRLQRRRSKPVAPAIPQPFTACTLLYLRTLKVGSQTDNI